MIRKYGPGLLVLGAVASACRGESPAAPPMFELLDSARTGVAFVNALPETPEFNIVNYLYYYNGGGVAVGDVNGDGHVDIYVCAVNYLTMHGHNVLYVNNGDGTFTDRTDEYGLAFEGYATQALFFDYDRDGDLDMYLLNNSTHAERSARPPVSTSDRNPRVADRLYRNDRGRFVDVSGGAGLHDDIDYGLGVVASDFNGDGCPDLYVANDFQENDYLYVNNCDGTFRDSIADATGHTSQFSMGVDAADVDNDLRTDVFVADMLPDRPGITRTTVSAEPFDLHARRIMAGYHAQVSRNTLQWNRGSAGGRGVRFSDIAPFAGVAATDWSWAPLLADFDNDGRKDLFVTTGIYRRPNDLDYIGYVANPAVQTLLARGDSTTMMSLLRRMPHVAMPNRAFRNEGGLRFTDVAERWGLREPGFSSGAAYVDLTNSGALDLVVNRINSAAAIYRNAGAVRSGHWIAVQLAGSAGNTAGIGARVTATAGGTRQLLEQMPTRGFQSSVDPRLHFGLGTSAGVDSLTVVWPDQRTQTLTNVPSDRLITLFQDSARGSANPPAPATPLFSDVTAASGLTFTHAENDIVDFTREPLIPRALSAEGPALAVADADGDGTDDVYLGGAKWQSGALFVQRTDARFTRAATAAFARDSLAEDVDATFFDANGDGRPDLYVVSGGNEFEGPDAALQDRLYVNDGQGRFHRDTAALPIMRESGSCVVAADFDGDGDLDLFVGRRAVARGYGLAPRTYLLENDGRGHFRDVAAEVAPGLSRAGMVTSAAWLDYDHDGRMDLVVAGEWMPVRVFHNEGRRLVDRTRDVGLAGTAGWWSSVTAADVNADGRADLVLGNAGLNSMLHPSVERPVRLYVGDFARTGSTLPIVAADQGDGLQPLASRDELVRAMPALGARYPSNASFATARIEDILSAAQRRLATVLDATTFASTVALSTGGGRFDLRRLPPESQLAPIDAVLAGDFDGDGLADLLLGGNLLGVAPMLGSYDAGYGLLLRGAPGGNFASVEMRVSGIRIEGQVRHIARVRTHDGSLIVVARNNDSPVVLRPIR